MKSLFQSFVITVGAVVAVVVLVPKSPVATLSEVQAFANEVVYHADVTDEDNAIYPETLKAVLENQSEYHETKVELGNTTGIFSDLKANTAYTLKIVAEKGFGVEILASEKIKTESRVGGAITSNHLLTPPDQELLEYEVGLLLADPEIEFKEIHLLFGTKYDYETEITYHQTLILSRDQTSIILPSVSNYNLVVSLILEGVYQDDSTIVLDSFEFNTPFRLFASLEPIRIDDNSVTLSVYTEMESSVEATYLITVKLGATTVKTIEIATASGSHSHYGQEIRIAGLKANTLYQVELVAKYTHPIFLTEETAIIGSVSIETLAEFDYDVVVLDQGTYYEVEILINDPEDNFQIGYYEIYQIEPEYDWYYSGVENALQIAGTTKTLTFMITKPDLVDYRIVIGARSESVYYNNVLMEEIKFD